MIPLRHEALQAQQLPGAIVLLLLAVTSIKGAEGVILLHGLSRSSASMVKLERALAAEGYVVVNCDYSSRKQPIEKLSLGVVGGALADERFRECSKVHFVTHSMGGILVRYYFANRKDERLGRVVMLGPPNKGSEVVDHFKGWWAFRKVIGPAGQQLGTDKDSVPNRLGPVSFELGVIAGDRSINWINSCMIKGRDDGKVSVERTKVDGMRDHLVVHTTHPFIMKNRRVITSVITFLKSGQFRPGSACTSSPHALMLGSSGA
jgi:pimeloyl-ACP methyl ester carboxylesterase